MKRFLVVCAAAMLCCSLVRAQEADDTGRGAELSIIPRVDVGVLYDLESKSASVSFGNTNLYTLFEGNFSEQWSFSLCNHWMASDWGYPSFQEGLAGPTAGLYHINLPGSGNNANNFLDWVYVTWAPQNFEFTLGKQQTLVGGFEFDDYDFDVNPLMASDFWSSYTCYQWGLTAAYNLPNEIGRVAVQATTNAVNRSIGLGLGWDGTYGPYSMKWSVYASPSYEYKEYPSAPWNVLVSLGNRLELGDFTFTADYFNACGDPNYLGDGNQVFYPSVYGNTVVTSFAFNLDDKWDFGAKGAWNKVNVDHPYGYQDKESVVIPAAYSDPENELIAAVDMPSVNAGAWVSWYPLAESQALRVQASAGVNSMRRDGTGYVFALLGVTYNFALKLW